MELIAAIGGGAFVLASFVMGIRLMLLSRKTRGFPEFILGLGLLLMGGIGYPLIAVAQSAPDLDMRIRIGLLLGNMLCAAIGMSGVGIFTRRVFRKDSTWAMAATPAIALGYTLCILAQALGPGLPATFNGLSNPWFISNYIGIAVMLWTGFESFRYYLMLRRRLALGLADAVVTNRFLLWTAAMVLAAVISIIGAILKDIFGVNVYGTTTGHLIVGPLGLLISVALWLAFLPPTRYLDRVKRRAAALATA